MSIRTISEANKNLVNGLPPYCEFALAERFVHQWFRSLRYVMGRDRWITLNHDQEWTWDTGCTAPTRLRYFLAGESAAAYRAYSDAKFAARLASARMLEAITTLVKSNPDIAIGETDFLVQEADAMGCAA